MTAAEILSENANTSASSLLVSTVSSFIPLQLFPVLGVTLGALCSKTRGLSELTSSDPGGGWSSLLLGKDEDVGPPDSTDTSSWQALE